MQSDISGVSGNKLARKLAMEARLKQLEYKSMEGLRRVLAENKMTALPSILTLPHIAEKA